MISEVSAKEFTNVLEKPSPDGFSISPASIYIRNEKPPFRAVFLLFLNLLVDFARSSVGIKLLKLNLTLYLLLVLAGTANVPGGRTQYDEAIL